MSRLITWRTILAAAMAGALVAALFVTTSTSEATFRGRNGRLLFEAPVGMNRQLFTILPDGTGLTQVTHFSDSGGTNAAWSKDGSRIVFTRHFDPGGPNERIFLYTINANGSGRRALPKAGDITVSPTWFPNGRRIIFLEIHSGKLEVINADDTGLRPAGIPGIGGDAVCFLGDGKRVAFLRPKPGDDSSTAIFVAGLFGHGLKRITPWAGHADKIDCSPDGKRIVYSAPEFGQPGGISSNVYTMKTDGTDVVQVTHDSGGTINDGADTWSPDGTKIAFTSNRAGTYQIYTANVDGTDVKRLTNAADAHLAAWGSHP
jgi:Tol biopolymer transport system component